jgi:hypothetical protein
MRFARNLRPRLGLPDREFWRRADKIAGDLNVLLVVLVVGLATLDFTFLLTQKIVERLPPMTRVVQEEAPPAPQLPVNRTHR